ncbi:MAG TPA: hypothetical protein ENI23_04895 [bacterium]|nr:hypothetical protein [bacterium]
MNEDKVTVLTACGGNDMEIPCRLFPNMKVAKLVCDGIFGMEGKEYSRGFSYQIDLESEEEPWPISNELFTSFYYGCGGPYKFVLTEIGFDVKFVGFDLD